MSEDFSIPRFSRAQINEAGKLLGTKIPHSDHGLENATIAFLRAYNWRDSHMLPMVHVRQELMGFGRRVAKGSISAARPKRMASIRKKLADKNNEIKLSQIQDLVGCRLIVATQEQLASVLKLYLSGESRHEIKHTDYIASPRNSGYRGHHVIAKFNNDLFGSEYKGLKVEIQLRTKLQHSWATAVEAVGLIRSENLKSGSGSAKWLRLFALIASEMAEIEGAELVSGTPTRRFERSAELKELNDELGALDLVRKFNATFKLSENYLPKTSRPYYLLRYDAKQNEVKIRAFHNIQSGLSHEHESGKTDESVTSVMVSVDKVDDLRAAYPNYFMDLEQFASVLDTAIEGKPLVLADESPSASAENTPSYLKDLSWLKGFQTR